MDRTRLAISAILYPLINALMFSMGAVTILTIPILTGIAAPAMMTVITVAFIASAPVAWLIAPHLRYRYWEQKSEAPGFPME